MSETLLYLFGIINSGLDFVMAIAFTLFILFLLGAFDD